MDLRIFLLLAASYLLYSNFCPTEAAAASEDLISFPYSAQPCKCAKLQCSCCQGILVNPINLEKRLCLNYTLSVLPLRVEFKILLDSSTIAEFSMDPLAPPKYCIPVPWPNSVGACVKFHDFKVLSLLSPQAIQVCSTFYVSYETQQVFAYKFPCVKLTTIGMSVMS